MRRPSQQDNLILRRFSVTILACHVYSLPVLRTNDTPDKASNPIYGKYFEGDMRFPVGFDPRNGIIGARYRWPNGIVPYKISSRFGRMIIFFTTQIDR